MKNSKEIVRALAMVTQLGISMLAPIILCATLGIWLDEKFGWSITAVLLVLGIMAGARNTWIMLKQVQQLSSKGRQKDEQKNK